jgi:hypothetical protein
MSIDETTRDYAYTYVIIDDTTGEDVYVGSSRSKVDRLYYHERPENACSSRQIIENGEYRFEIMEKFRDEITELNLRKKEQQLMHKMRTVYKMNVVNQINAYTSPHQRKMKQKKNRDENKERKRLYDLQRNRWKYTWGEVTDDNFSMFHIKDDLFC